MGYSVVGFHGYDSRTMQFAALLGWILRVISAVFHKRPSRVAIVFYGIFGVSFALWLEQNLILIT